MRPPIFFITYFDMAGRSATATLEHPSSGRELILAQCASQSTDTDNNRKTDRQLMICYTHCRIRHTCGKKEDTVPVLICFPLFCSILISRDQVTIWGITNICSGGSRISPRRGRQLPRGAPTYDFTKFSQKMHEIERIWTPGGGACPKFYYVDPPLICDGFSSGSSDWVRGET